MVSIAGKRALIVGASSGIGRAIAVSFAKEGALVLAAARRQERLDELKREHPAMEVAVADASDAGQMEALAARAGAVDILVYATGTNVTDRAMNRLTVPIWDEVIQVNLNGAYYATRAVLPGMRERGAGHLIYTASISGIVPDVSGAAYQASKRGMLGLAHAIRVEERERGIRTCVICPGLVETEILDRRPVKPTAEMLAKALQPEDVAEAVLFAAKLPPRAAVPEMQLMPATL